MSINSVTSSELDFDHVPWPASSSLQYEGPKVITLANEGHGRESRDLCCLDTLQ